MKIDIITIFPQMFSASFNFGLIKKAQERGLIEIRVHNLRDFATDKHRKVDDYPYSGGAGMVLKPEPIFAAVESVKEEGAEIILLSPSGELFNQSLAHQLSRKNQLILICGRYEGVDERVREYLCTRAISIGDYILMGGEVAAMVIVEVVARLIPGVLGSAQSLREESIEQGLLEYPQYTRPAVFRGWKVPEVLLSGNHQAIAKWHKEQSLLRTLKYRPDLITPRKSPGLQ